MLPNFVIIGTMKGGTTSLYHYLRAHPQVFMPSTKELHFFVQEKNLGRGREWYERQFREAGDAIAVGEASPDYTKYPVHQGVPERIAAVMPDVRLVYLLRNPVERIRSHYLHDVARGRERRSIDEAVPGNEHYLAPSRYWLQIEQYLKHFPAEQMLIVTSESLRADRAATLRTVHRFLGVDTDWSAPEQDREFNAISGKSAPGPLIRVARAIPGASRLRLRYGRHAVAAEQFLRRSRPAIDVQAGQMSGELREALLEELSSDLSRLSGFLGDGFDAWGLQ